MLAVGALLGLAVYLKNHIQTFKLFHLVALFCVLSALVSASVSAYPDESLLKAVSFLLLFVYAAAGARTEVPREPVRFFNALVLGVEILVWVSALLYFDLREQHCRRRSRDWNLPRFRAANPIKDFRFFARDQNSVQRGQRSTHNVDAAYKFVRPSVGIDPPYQNRQNLECLRHGPLREREAALDVFEIQSVRLALLLDFVNQLLP